MPTKPWPDSLRPAKFRDAEFSVIDSRTTIGRRNTVNEYPDKDVADWDDMGRRAPAFSISCFILEPDYMAKRNKFMVAIEKRGPGQLVHPFLGTKYVVVDGEAEVTESTYEGGMARFDVRFKEVGKQKFPDSRPDNPALIGDKVTDCNYILQQNAIQFYNATADNYLATLAGRQVTAVANSAKQNLAKVAALWDTDLLFETIENMNLLIDSAISVIRSPAALFEIMLRLLYQSFADLATTDPKAAMYAAVGLSSITESGSPSSPIDPIPGNGYTAVQARTNLASLISYSRRQALVTACSCIATTTFDSFEEADYIRKLISDALNTELVNIGADEEGDEIFQAITDLFTTTANAIEDAGLGLSRSITFDTGAGNYSSLNVAQELYGDISREPEILDLNPHILEDPGFLPGGTALRVMPS